MNTHDALHQRHAVVTGGGSGIGAATAAALLKAGARVTLMGREMAKLVTQREKLGGGEHIACVSVDVADEAAVNDAFARATQALGDVDILVNNAGQATAAPFAQTDLALWKRMLDVNLTGAFLCTRAVLPAMLARKHGRIVNVASTAGQVGYPYVAAYCASKHGVIGMTRALALEVATQGVTVNAVCPGYTETELLQASLEQITRKTSRSEAEARSILVRHNPQQRFVTPDEVANAVLWLCAPGSSAITGQSISVSGGEIT
ncbi:MULTISPECIES: SDR family NAD(P)-dependent oxidoreductase [Paraburkholderia]|uniref:NAD(P)-dependent dehydrogenase (Short-subunit alcohol dehydrogenase family) n=1 Tax=Paraburkholderia tropica TaxID=92647 RepID=A0A1A5WZI3_9BURK|nr:MULTISPECIES: SDR family oxidoreductase [Paraburkholderia]MBB2980987.1 NAD(P)-dependent dehydrogenase (short-subunit alcohol dehydrogenase family) [Paraburkholderia tropica]MBB3002194.1 NAD(P)-dependent dehydrogenase (short-subunit alcohol dehydrogenase family) [Paraburkholderia tropica]MBB6321577.1 NAD(P)-dependent dehydrogenase (short-subunit alcohol dehydrogenase family) [Paraburkholderia tropica]MDE1138692.1 SDR family NAD(P)-dependent oxidoreductase [Paraburkholderia tropica]OBR46671.1